MEVLGTAGDAALGGTDFDRRLATWLLAEAAAQGIALPAHGEQFAHESEAQGWALEAAEAAKIALSSESSAEVALPGGASLALTQHQFEEVTSELFQLMANVLEVLGDALFVEWAVRPSDAVPGRVHGSSPADDDGEAASSSSNSSGGGSSSKQRQGGQWAPPPRRITQVALVGQLTRLPSVQQFVARITGDRGSGWAGGFQHGADACIPCSCGFWGCQCPLLVQTRMRVRPAAEAQPHCLTSTPPTPPLIAGVQPRMTVDPAEAVALGAAIHAGVLLGEVRAELAGGVYLVGRLAVGLLGGQRD